MTWKMAVAHFMAESLGSTAHSCMNDCEIFGMTFGCQSDCPQLIDGKCPVYLSVEDYLAGKERVD